MTRRDTECGETNTVRETETRHTQETQRRARGRQKSKESRDGDTEGAWDKNSMEVRL